jgi:hypothetical protein
MSDMCARRFRTQSPGEGESGTHQDDALERLERQGESSEERATAFCSRRCHTRKELLAAAESVGGLEYVLIEQEGQPVFRIETAKNV